MNFRQLVNIVDRIDNDSKYILRFNLYHLDVYGDISNCIQRLEDGELYCRQGHNRYYDYDHSILNVIYYNNSGELIIIDKKFQGYPYSLIDANYLTEQISKIEECKSIKPFVMSQTEEPMRAYPSLKSKILYNLDKFQTLEQLSDFVCNYYSYTDFSKQKPNITSVDDIVVSSSIRASVDKCHDTTTKSNVFDFIDVTVHLVSHGYSKNEMIAFVEKFKPDIDKKVCAKIKPILNKYGVPLNFIKISNLTLTNDNTLLYKLSIKSVDTHKNS